MLTAPAILDLAATAAKAPTKPKKLLVRRLHPDRSQQVRRAIALETTREATAAAASHGQAVLARAFELWS